MIRSRIFSVHKPSGRKRAERSRLTHENEPACVRRTKMFDVSGSKDSELPRICDVEGVGIKPTKSEFFKPYFCISSFFAAQSYRVVGGVTFHMSNCKMPCD